MKMIPCLRQKNTKAIVRSAVVSLSALALTACMGGGELWQGEEVLYEARQEVLEKDVYTVSDDHRALKDRFDALERLYIELVHEIRSQTTQMTALESKMSNVEKDPEEMARLTKMRNDVSMMREQMKKLENRVFSVEMSETAASNGAVNTTAPAPDVVSPDPVQASSNAPAANSNPAVNNVETPDQTFYGVHLASFRSKEQVNTGWAGLMESFGDSLEGLTPLLYTQSQEGIGTFLRLIAGPLINEQEATSLCDRIKQAAKEQYCRVSEYQGEPVE